MKGAIIGDTMKKYIYSIHLCGKIAIPKEAIIRVNMAFVSTRAKLEHSVKSVKNDVFLDIPTKRVKPPIPLLGLGDALHVMNRCSNVKYFAVSNSEKWGRMRFLRSKVPAHIKIIPKIETALGVANLKKIVNFAKTDTIMLDKTDLFFDVKDCDIYEKLIKQLRKSGVKILEQQGVIFGTN